MKKIKIKKKERKKEKFDLLINIPWKEEVLRSFSIHFLSMRLSSTARTWNCDSPAIPIALLHPKKASKKKYVLMKESENERWMHMGGRWSLWVYKWTYLAIMRARSERLHPESWGCSLTFGQLLELAEGVLGSFE